MGDTRETTAVFPESPPGPPPVMWPRRRLTPAAVAWSAFPGHMGLCGAGLFVLGMDASVVGGGYDALDSFVGVALVAAVFTLLALLVGSPIRFVPPVRRWWFAHGGWSLVVALLGTASFVLAYRLPGAHLEHVRGVDGDPSYTALVPSVWPSAIGYCATAFGLAHVWFPRRWTPRQFRPFAERRPDRGDWSKTPANRIP